MQTIVGTAKPVPTYMKLIVLVMMTMMTLSVMSTGTNAQNVTTCTAVTTRSSTIVKCHFAIDVSKIWRNFNVQFYYPASASDSEMVLMCNFGEKKDLQCKNAPGVSFDRVVSNEITITRPPSRDKVGGRYRCQLVPPVNTGGSEFCTLAFLDIPEAQTSRSTPLSPSADTPPADTPPADTDGSGESHAVIILLVIIIVIVVAIGICVALAYVKRDRWAKSNGVARAEENMDPEKNTSQTSSLTGTEFSKIPEGWPTYFYNMGWKAAAKGEPMQMEEEKDVPQPKAAEEEPQAPGHKQQTSGVKTGISRFLPAIFSSSSKTEPNLGDRGAAAPLLESSKTPRNVSQEDTRAGPIGTSIHESTEAELYHDAGENPVSPGVETCFSPATKNMKKLQAEQKKAEKERVKREKEAAEQKAKETIGIAEREAKRITDGAKGKPKEEIKKAKLEADGILKKAREVAKHIKEGTGKGDNEGNQNVTTNV